ncbi:MAG TPA: 50S ribosomal protein L4 [Candidatus Cloacimonas acidaminovorans]|jgi:large subunit ribosomal protein L4|nr:50S ribosomal protein L4 [Candidatus Cloacimonas sp.]NLM89759.1 50S ribosomal protein L4 [Candidatus Cloacimonadota bacterium]OQC72932.1 MAG: 50S ribosomal protein L4 [Candidatus Cloacimonetes bacterium ADurb.Bin003]HNV62223.1 50S ribosomal protein L4 [Candidatus Cloacimonas acidaminovorans]HNZ89292.1 50S ribosomal protein L4 [Candidatus Cloacimonas acidaminovorans]
MLTAKRYNMQGELLGEVDLPEGIFEVDVNAPKILLNEVVTMFLANQRQGTVQKKNRSMTAGSTRKLFRQKGTGNARVGTRRSPIRVHGGKAFAIYPKDWYRKIPRTKKRLALKVALTDRAREGRIMIVDNLSFEKPNTKLAVELLNKIIPEKGYKLIVTDGHHIPTVKSFANLPEVMTDRADSLNAYEVLKSSYIIMTDEALKKVEEVFNK